MLNHLEFERKIDLKNQKRAFNLFFLNSKFDVSPLYLNIDALVAKEHKLPKAFVYQSLELLCCFDMFCFVHNYHHQCKSFFVILFFRN